MLHHSSSQELWLDSSASSHRAGILLIFAMHQRYVSLDWPFEWASDVLRCWTLVVDGLGGWIRRSVVICQTKISNETFARQVIVQMTSNCDGRIDITYCNISDTSRKCFSADVVGGASTFERLIWGMGNSLSQTAYNSRSFLFRDATIPLQLLAG